MRSVANGLPLTSAIMTFAAQVGLPLTPSVGDELRVIASSGDYDSFGRKIGQLVPGAVLDEDGRVWAQGRRNSGSVFQIHVFEASGVHSIDPTSGITGTELYSTAVSQPVVRNGAAVFTGTIYPIPDGARLPPKGLLRFSLADRSISLLARERDHATEELQYWKIPVGPSGFSGGSQLMINDDGDTCLGMALYDGGIVRVGAVLTGDRVPAIRVVEGQMVPAPDDASLSEIRELRVSELNDAGQISLEALLDHPEGAVKSIFRSEPDGSVTMICSENQLDAQNWSIRQIKTSSRPHPLNNLGQVLFVASAQPPNMDGEPSPVMNPSVLYLGDGTNLTQIAAAGDPVPGRALTMTSIDSLHRVNDAGEVVFLGFSGDRECLISGSYNNLETVYVTGDPAPGGGVFGQLETFCFNEQGDVVFMIRVHDDSSATQFRLGLFHFQSRSGLVKVFVSGDQIAGYAVDLVDIAGQGRFSPDQSGRHRSGDALNDQGACVFFVSDGFRDMLVGRDVPRGCVADRTTTSTNPGDPLFAWPDGVVDGWDLSIYIEAWLTNQPRADETSRHANPLDAAYGQPDGAVDGADLSYFVEAWLAGCP